MAVALRKESVDRNWYSSRIIMLVLGVALRKESVDRNGLLPKNTTGTPSSLSARRAWIEISILRGEGLIPPSLSARRAWIEISTQCRL